MKLGDFGLFASALLAVTLGLAGFCLSCFAAIFGILAYNKIGHHTVDFADSYRYVALPFGLATLLLASAMLLGLWVRRMVRK